MARPGRPRAHEPIADSIRQAITYSTTEQAIGLLKNTDIDVLDGEARTPLIHAALNGKTEILSWLIAHGADLDHQDRNGWSALHFAVQEKRIETVTCLLKHGATVHHKDIYGNTPLWRATVDARGNYEVVKLLLSYGADPHSKNTSDRSPLDFARQIGDNELIELLRNR